MPKASIDGNTHAHVLMTTRTVGPQGLGEKTLMERENKWLLNHNHPTSHVQLREIRQAWEHHANRHLARAGLDLRIDHRSHQERGLEIEPSEHMGVHASQMDRRGLVVSRARIDEKAAWRSARPHTGRARLEPVIAAKVGRIKDIARLVDRGHSAELSRQHELKRTREVARDLGT